MRTRSLLLALPLIALAVAARAACPTPFPGKDGNGNPQNFGVTVDAGQNCYANFAIVDGANAANKATVTAGGALKTDSSATTQPISGTITALEGGAPWSTNITQFGGAAVVTGTGASGAGIPRFTLSNDSTLSSSQKVQPWDGTTTVVVKAASTNALATDPALVVSQSPNPSSVCTLTIPINQTASTDIKTSTNKLHICSVILVSAGAQNLSLVEGTGATCATGTAALIGGLSASIPVAANGGFSAVSPRPWLVTGTTADHLCLLQSGVFNVSGVITAIDHT